MSMTIEELMAQGYDKETAELLAQASGGDSKGSLPFPVLKFSYDQEDVLIGEGVKKGNFISGYVVDKQQLVVKEKGDDWGNSLEFVIVASVYQNSHYDTDTRSTDVITDIFYSSYESRQTVDKKSGLTIGELKDAGKKIKFNNILLLLVKQGKEFIPYVHYMHGTNYHAFTAKLEDLGVKSPVLGYTFKVKSKKVPTNFQPAWIMDIVSAEPRAAKDVMASVPAVSAAMKEFNAWIESSNKAEISKPDSAEDTTPVPDNVEVDIDEDEIPF